MAIVGYTKLFNSIVTSTIWGESNTTRIVWITMLASCDKDGFVPASIPGLANLARVGTDECREAIKVLESPDDDSRSQEFEGRRIEKVEGGWRLLNHSKYRKLLSEQERREYNTRKQREYRERQKMSTNVDSGEQFVTASTHTDTDTDTDTDSNTDTEERKTLPQQNALGSQEFKAFLEQYPIQTGRKAALHEWCKQRLDSLAGEVMLSLSRWKASDRWKDETYIPYPAKWLADQWKSEPVKGTSKDGQKRERTKQAIERVRAELAK